MPELLESPAEAPAKRAPSRELVELRERYLAWMKATRFAATTIKGTKADLDWLYKYLMLQGIDRIADATPEVLNGYSLWMREIKNNTRPDTKLAMRSINHRLIATRQFFKWLASEMIVLADPAEDLERPKLVDNFARTIITQAEAKKLLSAPDLRTPVGYRDRTLLELVYSTGVRSAELFRLRVDEIDLKARTMFIKQGKGGKDRLIPLPRLAVGYLAEFIAKVRPEFARRAPTDCGRLFLNDAGRELEINKLCKILGRATLAAKIDKRITAMTLRHSIASHLLENGMDIRYIQEFLGHDKLSTTQIYAKVTLSGLRRSYNRHHPKEKRVRSLT